MFCHGLKERMNMPLDVLVFCCCLRHESRDGSMAKPVSEVGFGVETDSAFSSFFRLVLRLSFGTYIAELGSSLSNKLSLLFFPCARFF